MDDESDETDDMTEERAAKIVAALQALQESVVTPPRERRAVRTTALLTSTMRQCLLAAAEAMLPADNGEPLDGLRAEIVVKALRVARQLEPLLLSTLGEPT